MHAVGVQGQVHVDEHLEILVEFSDLLHDGSVDVDSEGVGSLDVETAQARVQLGPQEWLLSEELTKCELRAGNVQQLNELQV